MDQPLISHHLRRSRAPHLQSLISPETLRIYFRSGWAFLIPYLAAYLLYAWLKLPVNSDGGGGVTLPSLLHVYWVLHILHVVLGTIALLSWWRSRFTRRGSRSYLKCQLSALSPLLPWCCLALLFWVPGIYLEWPSDPWEHLRRINEWSIVDQVTAHSAWKKSSYFLPYSVWGHYSALTQVKWLNVYYVTICLLLCWQYYLLARAVGIGQRGSFIYILLQALLTGNSIFSFYRYYGLSSSIYAQIGAVALTRIVHEALSACCTEPQTDHSRAPYYVQPGTRYTLLRAATAALALLPLMAFNHIQGIGIAGLGMLAVIIYRFVKWRRTTLGWLSFAALLASVATVLWYPEHPALIEIYRRDGWLNTWYGFNLFSPTSPTFDRSLHIFGAFGILNLALGLWLVFRRNHIVGWLTLTPVLALALPCFAVPFASLLAGEKSVENIVTFHRLLFAVPFPLAMVATASHLGRVGTPPMQIAGAPKVVLPVRRLGALGRMAPLVIPIGLFSVLVVSAGPHSFNRFWHTIQVTAKDLQVDPFVPSAARLSSDHPTLGDILIINSPSITEVRDAFAPRLAVNLFRDIHRAPNYTQIVSSITELVNALSHPAFSASIVIAESETLPGGISVRPVNSAFTNATHVIAELTAPKGQWISLGGQTPIADRQSGKLVVSNPPGAVSHAFNAEMIPMEPSKRYLLSAMIRQIRGNGVNYLAVAWYDRAGRFLVSNEASPRGADRPAGWISGTFSYYGLVNQSAKSEWSQHTISFGLGELAEIPRNAAFLRAGALLNENASSDSAAEIANVTLSEKSPYRKVVILTPGFESFFTPGSQAGRLSGHWAPHYIAACQMGTKELRPSLGNCLSPAGNFDRGSD